MLVYSFLDLAVGFEVANIIQRQVRLTVTEIWVSTSLTCRPKTHAGMTKDAFLKAKKHQRLYTYKN